MVDVSGKTTMTSWDAWSVQMPSTLSAVRITVYVLSTGNSWNGEAVVSSGEPSPKLQK